MALPLAPGEFRKHGMGFVHQHLGLIPSLTVLENLFLGRLAERERWAINWGAERARARGAFRQFRHRLDPDGRLRDIPPVERALLAIVRAIEEMTRRGERRAGLLVLDEPTPFPPERGVDRLFGWCGASSAKARASSSFRTTSTR